MKGIILGINPEATLVDLSHQIPPQDIQTAGFQLASACQYFPPGTIHLVVVDPGVGSQRQAIAVDLDDWILVGPNNGVFDQVLAQTQARSAVCLDTPQYWLSNNPSKTFHGRDIFAPVAAHLSKGIPISQVGSPISVEHDLHQLRTDQTPTHSLEGQILAIDHFGNLITTIPGQAIAQAESWGVFLADHWIQGDITYSTVAPGEAVALIGSHGLIEIAINQGNAQAQFHAQINDPVRLGHTL